MSAFIVEDKTINSIVTFLGSTVDANDSFKRAIDRLLKEHNIDLYKNESLQAFAEAMLHMNKKAVDHRYKETNIVDINFKFVYENSKYQLLKSLRCYLYQCCEGEVMRLPLYELLEQVADRIQYEIVTTSKEYDEARWG